MLRKIAKYVLPPMSFRRKLVKKILVAVHLKSPVVAGYYNTLYHQASMHPQFHSMITIKNGPLISIVVPAYNTPQRYLDDLIYSVTAQSYESWELIIVNASTQRERREAITEVTHKDTRIRVIEVENNGIAANTNAGISIATGDYIAFCDHDDVIEPHALYEVARVITSEHAEVVYTDEDKISDDGEIYFDPHYKPDWNPDLFMHVNYTNHLSVVKKSILDTVGQLDSRMDGAQDYDLMLRVIDTYPKIIHIPKVLYHWRAAQNSTAQDFSSKKYVTEAGKKALESHFKRIGMSSVRVSPKELQPGFYELQYKPYENITIIILPFASDALLRLYVEILIKKTSFKKMKVQLIVPKGASPRFNTPNVSVSTIPSGDNYLIHGLKTAIFDQTILIDTLALPSEGEWINVFTPVLRLDHIYAASPLILFDGNIIEDCGLIKRQNTYRPLFKNQPARGNQTFFGNTSWVRDVDRLSGGVTLVRTQEFRYFIGEDETKTPANYYEEKRYALLHTETTFNCHSIRLVKRAPERVISMFNPNIDPNGDVYEVYTPEAAAVSVLITIAESEGVNL